MEKRTNVITESNMIMVVDKNKEEAEKIIQNEDKFEKLIQKVETTINEFPAIGKYISDIVCMVSLVRKYIKKEYTDIPKSSIISIIVALIYLVTPIDIIPDAIPGIGMIDDVAVIAWVIKSIHSDVEKYKKWRIDNNIQIEENL